MSLREELQNRADKLDAELLALSGRIRAIERESDDLHTCINALDIAEMDAQDAALEIIPTPEEIGIALDEIEAAEAKLLEDEPEPSLFDAEPSDEEHEDELAEPEIERGATIYAQHEAMRAAGFEPVGNPEDDGPIQWRVKDAPTEIISDLTGDPAIEPETGLHADPEPTELDAEPASVLDNPELLAAVERAEATLQEAEPAYVGLQDAELDAEFDAMKEREKADKPKLHFSIFGERGNRKLENVE